MSLALAELIRTLSPTVTPRDITELPLLTLGSPFQGSRNTQIGEAATEAGFLAIAEIVNAYTTEQTGNTINLRNPSGRTFVIARSGDPDIRIQELIGDRIQNHIAIEIKGGTDASNAHNRAGEAEKSHTKAKSSGYRECWTVMFTAGISLSTLKSESPTTDVWFDAGHVLAREGSGWEDFRRRLAVAVGLPID
jgi:hypothetical protein